jgi:hypothetical protein
MFVLMGGIANVSSGFRPFTGTEAFFILGRTQVPGKIIWRDSSFPNFYQSLCTGGEFNDNQ